MSEAHTRSATDWFHDAKWGVFTHYLGQDSLTSDEWSDQVDRFDVQGLAKQLGSVGAGYYFITIGQISGHYCAPNETYDSIVGIKPSKCSRRDLISDLYDALNPLGIHLLVYLPCGAPFGDPVAVEKFEWESGWTGEKGYGKRLESFQLKWEATIRDWSLRWGKKVRGWWLDGSYFSEFMYRFPEPPNFASFAAALKAGNPDSIVGFNPGVTVPVISLTEYEDYTAGEISDALPSCPGRWVDGAQYHILTFLGQYWGSPDGKSTPRFSDELVCAYTKYLTSKGGVITWEVPISRGGVIDQECLSQLGKLRSI